VQTISKTIHPREYDDVKTVVENVQKGDLQLAKTLLQQLNAQSSNHDPAAAIQQAFFVNALAKRVSEPSAESQNLYLQGDEGQQIKMFNFMAEKFPVVKAAQEIANQVLISQLKTNQQIRSLTILDIGIGTGQQMISLLEKLYQEKEFALPITIIGIEPAADSLELAQQRVAKLNEQAPAPITFKSIHKTFETVNENDWTLIQNTVEETGSRLYINASFALHHIQPVTLREALFSRLRRLNPLAFTLIEPYADYIDSDLQTRFNNAWHHYGLTFKAIDSIDAPIEDKNAVKRIFFGREIQDVLSHDQLRVEQFETAEMWLEKLQKAGFTPIDLDALTSNQPAHPLISISHRSHYLGLDVDGYPIVAVMAVQ
jgi:hypothetical protein